MSALLGESGLLRIAGCPVRVWLDAANPAHTAALRAYDRDKSASESVAASLAERIGDELIPNDALDREGRRQALRLRRRLHNGSLDSGPDLLAVACLADSLPATRDLAASLRSAHALHARLCQQERTLEAAITDEVRRVDLIALDAALNEPSVRHLVRFRRNEQLAERLARPVDDRRAHHYAEYVWDIIERATTRSTPRDWHGQVARLWITTDSEEQGVPVVEPGFATIWRENLHAVRRSLQHGAWPPPDATRLSLAPLCWTTEDHVLALTSDPDNPAQVHEVQLRRTPLLNAIIAALAPGAREAAAFERGAIPAAPPEDVDLIWGFVEYLVSLGVVQPARTPHIQVQGWDDHPADQNQQPSDRSGFTDVYRRVSGGIPPDIAARLQTSVEVAQRVLAAIHSDQASPRTGISADDDYAVPLLALLREPLLHPDVQKGRPDRSRHWPVPRQTDSVYTAICRRIGEHAGEPIFNLDRALLDACGAPSGQIDWPVDAIMRLARPGASYLAVLDEMFPAGSMDARFVTDLARLGEPLPHVTAYRDFLRQIEEASGITFVEVLVPPLSEGAANAVRRPLYTGAWTGDPDLCTYIDADEARPRFIPLQSISLRHSSGRLIAETDGQRICPMYHATRIPLAPWNVVLETLMTTSPLPLRWAPRRLHRTLDAFPEHDHLPRIATGDLVLAGEQWRIDPGRLWRPTDQPLTKARTLERLRDRLDLPRWIFIKNGTARPTPCDLDSVRAIRTIEQMRRGATHLLLIEMVPSPPDFWLYDGQRDARCSSVMLRLPVNETSPSMVARIASQFAASRHDTHILTRQHVS